MTRDKAIAELVRIWHSPHLDLSLKAGLAEVIETLKEKNQSDSLVTDSSDECKEIESKLDLISRQDAISAIEAEIRCADREEDVSGLTLAESMIDLLPSAEPQPKPISYIECANAMLKMWIDNVLTDGEYYRIMEKLNSKHMADMRGGDDE